VPAGGFRAPETIEIDAPSELAAESNRADYIVIAHPRLKEAVEPLAELHRRRGLAVEVVDVVDVYDEFNHGILHPRASRDFLAHAYHRWAPPRPRFVLLVGDASWDTKNARPDSRKYAAMAWKPQHGTRLVGTGDTSYAEEGLHEHRNLMPTWSASGRQGHAASDNWLVAVDGDDFDPDLAIGRLPVVEPEDVEAIVRKTVRYVEEPEVGPWRRSALWVTNEVQTFQARTNRLAAQMASEGFDGVKVYPDPEQVANADLQRALAEALAEGQLLVHFTGHGGRFIWRTGVPDYRDQQDLFTLDDLDALPETRRLPLVLSMTCYSAPFDHPTADSIGEKFLRLADRGAVAVLGASWRNTPGAYFSTVLIDALMTEETIGEAVNQAKRARGRRELTEVYNLLGDPALPLARPVLEVRLAASAAKESALQVSGEVAAAGFTGRAIVDALDAEGELLESLEIEVDGPRFEAWLDSPRAPGAEIASVRAYVWNETVGVDGIASAEVPSDEPDGSR
jgi:hypothetical protein